MNSVAQDVVQNGKRIVPADEESRRKSIFDFLDCTTELVLRSGTSKYLEYRSRRSEALCHLFQLGDYDIFLIVYDSPIVGKRSNAKPAKFRTSAFQEQFSMIFPN
jgi:hypothetical protein